MHTFNMTEGTNNDLGKDPNTLTLVKTTF